jgi:cytoskeletal protein RodZ
MTTIDYLNAADKFWLGEQLSASRLASGLDVPTAARLLALSQAQVMAIEAGSQGPFMHIAHYVRSVRRFAESMSTTHSTAVLNWLEQMEEVDINKVAVSSQTRRIDMMLRARLPSDAVMPTTGRRLSRLGSLGTGFALIVSCFMVTLLLIWDADHTENSVADHQVALQQSPGLVSLNSDVLASEASNVTAQRPDLTDDANQNLDHAAEVLRVALTVTPTKKLSLQFTAPCWVQVTSHDGQVTEKLYVSAELLQLDLSATASLVIGNVTGTTALTENGQHIDFSAFVAGGNVARLTDKDLVYLSDSDDQIDNAL